MADHFEINVEEFAKALQSDQSFNFNGKIGLLVPLIKQVTEAALDAALDN
ncbi:hypothetical protein [Vibrio sp. vnigr-6D03]|nr:hypothetical protein [Vibrio sp. vnigr-6D03]